MGAFKSFHYVHYRISNAGVHVVLHLKRRIQKIHLDFTYFIDVTVSRKKTLSRLGALPQSPFINTACLGLPGDFNSGPMTHLLTL